jgi:acetyl-CoA acetyltransferase
MSLHLTREEQDSWSARSHQILAAARSFLADEIAPFAVPGPRVQSSYLSTTVARRDHRFNASHASARLRIVGNHHAGNSSQITRRRCDRANEWARS